MLIKGAEVSSTFPVDVRLAAGKIRELGRDLARRSGEACFDAAGGVLLPGLHDHHLHLFALAAAMSSLRCGPPEVRDRAALTSALTTCTAPGEWIRGVGYFESVAGDLDRRRLDAIVSGRPLRIQHRSGALWMLNSAGIDRLGLDRGVDAPGVERDATGLATGRLFQLDAWLRERLGTAEAPCLAAVGRRLASFGVTGLTDATPGNGSAELRALVDAVDRGELPQRIVVMGAAGLPDPSHAAVERGAVKVRLAEHDLPRIEELERIVESAHLEGRPVAFHCVTRVELVLAATVFAAVGASAGDRIEHAAVAPPDVMSLLAELGVTVVTQPNFVRERGDAYAAHVEAADRPWLYRCRGFLEASVPLGAGTDAPFGDPDPWLAMQAAVDRCTESGLPLGPDERLVPERALALFTSPAESPGDPPRKIAVGSRADLCLLDRPWSQAREQLASDCVAATIRGGSVVWERTGGESP